ncbi:putative exoenzymes regulatory protein aepA precursor [Paraphoma chrysanthemicola]|uniref:Exoenzymes regulatory protein aepA n=1 Tax=Paraphoma chrysanthemicola TaxID=798071 RepID=A0A8K0R7W6_9PLEO|nr:putative exoenzymes regulatory protein aepA precursor [Paraphoma chrysanthemicola]
MASSSLPTSQQSNSLAYVNGRVYTIDDSQPWVEAFIVSEYGIFTHVGSNASIQEIAKESNIVTTDLKGQFVMPGIHDAHMHLLMSGLALTSGAVIGMDATHLDIASQIKHGCCACEYINVYQNWILAAAYNNQGFPDGIADRKYLDEIFPDTPVVIQGGAGHSSLLNTEALKRAGYDVENEPDTHAAKFFRREDGSLTGELGESAMSKSALAIPKPSPAHVKRTLKHAIHLAHKAGVTSTQEASTNTQLLQALSEMEKEGSLNLDISAHIVYGCEWLASESKDSLNQLLDAADRFKSKHVDTHFVKIMLDGVPLPPLYTHAGLDEHGHVDQTRITTPDVAAAVSKFDKLGRTVKIHCTGHGSTRLALDAIEAARKENPHGPRHEIAHNSGVHKDDYPRYKRLNTTAEMSPAELFVHPLTSASSGLMNWDFPAMLSANAHVTIGSDWGAVPDPSLFASMARIVSSVGNGDQEKGGQMLCRMLTINGAVAIGKEDVQGSVEVGKKASFIVVDRDLSKGEFEGAKVLRTYFEGEKVWDANAV